VPAVKRIYKFPLLVCPEQHIEMPIAARILCCEVQRDTICLWAVVDPEAPKVHRTFRIIGTGNAFNDDDRAQHVGTIQLEGGQFVFHVFEQLR
jgi:hypothetical protein